MLKIGSMFCNMCVLQKAFKSTMDDLKIINSFAFSIEDDEDACDVYKAMFDLDTTSINTVKDHRLDNVDILLVGFSYFQDKSKREISQYVISQSSPKWIVFETSFDYFLTNKHHSTQQALYDFLSSEGYLIDFYPLNTKYFQTPLDKNQVIIIAHSNKNYPRWVNDRSKIKMFNLGFDMKYEVNKCLKDILEDVSNIDQNQNINSILSSEDVDDIYAIDKLLSDQTNRNLQIYYPIGFQKVFFLNGLCPPISEQGVPIIVDHRVSSKNSFPILQPSDPKEIDLFSNGFDFESPSNKQTYSCFSIRHLNVLECMRLYGFSNEDYALLKSKNIADEAIISLLVSSTHINLIKAIAKHILIHDKGACGIGD